MNRAALISVVAVSLVILSAARQPGRARAAGRGGSGSSSSSSKDASGKPTKLVSDHQAHLRLQCLRMMSLRGTLEQMLADVPASNKELRAKVVEALSAQWAQAQDPALTKQCSAVERSALGSKLGGWKPQQIVDASWRIESAAVIAWALGYSAQLPDYDQQATPKEVFAHLGDKPRLRSAAAISGARDTAELWHWRARTTQLQRSGRNPPLPPGYTLPRIIAETAELAQKRGLFHSKGGDFPAFGKPYRDLNDEELSLATSIAMERQRALNWLCGYSDDWDHVPTDT
jgi:hypothetical protein